MEMLRNSDTKNMINTWCEAFCLSFCITFRIFWQVLPPLQASSRPSTTPLDVLKVNDACNYYGTICIVIIVVANDYEYIQVTVPWSESSTLSRHPFLSCGSLASCCSVPFTQHTPIPLHGSLPLRQRDTLRRIQNVLIKENSLSLRREYIKCFLAGVHFRYEPKYFSRKMLQYFPAHVIVHVPHGRHFQEREDTLSTESAILPHSLNPPRPASLPTHTPTHHTTPP